MKTKLLSLVLCLLALFSFACVVSAENESNIDRINDQMGVLTETEEAVLAELLEESYKKYEIQVMLITTKSTSFSIDSEERAFAAAESQAERFYTNTNELSREQNGVVLVYYEFKGYRGLCKRV
jgi:uncharacterized membrane protein YgcG